MAREIVKDAFWTQASDMPLSPTEALMRARPFDEPDTSYLELWGLGTMVEDLEATLSDDQRELLRMVVYEKLSFREIARQLHTSKSSAHRSWRTLVTELAVKLAEQPEVQDHLSEEV